MESYFRVNTLVRLGAVQNPVLPPRREPCNTVVALHKKEGPAPGRPFLRTARRYLIGLSETSRAMLLLMKRRIANRASRASLAAFSSHCAQ